MLLLTLAVVKRNNNLETNHSICFYFSCDTVSARSFNFCMIATAIDLWLCMLLFNHDIISRSWRPPKSKIVGCVQCLVPNLINFSFQQMCIWILRKWDHILYCALHESGPCLFLPFFSPFFDGLHFWLLWMGYSFDYFWWVTFLTTFDGWHFWLLLVGYIFDYFWWVTFLTTFDGLHFWLLLMVYSFDYFWLDMCASGLYTPETVDFLEDIYIHIVLPNICHSSGAVWELRWTSWAVRPNEPFGFCGRKDLLNHASALVTTCP